MPSPFNAASYRDCHFAMEAALNRDGLQYVCESVGQAVNFKQRCNRYRVKLREQDAKTMAHIPGYLGESPFDALTIRQVDASGTPSREGTIIQFEHAPVGKGKLIDPTTGEEITMPKLDVDRSDLGLNLKDSSDDD